MKYCLVNDSEGALLECIEKTLADTKEPVVELHVGTAEESDGRVPVQIVTRSMIERGRPDRSRPGGIDGTHPAQPAPMSRGTG